MGKYILKRLLTLLPVLIGITIFAFLLGVLSPGDPARAALSGREEEGIITDEMLEAKRHEMGLDSPFFVQYFDWMGRVLRGDLGESLIDKKDIAENFRMRFPVTIELAVISTGITFVLGVGLGILMAFFHGKWLDHLLNFLATFSMSLPSFWVALLLMTVFSETLHWLDTSGYEGFHSLIMPSAVLSLGAIGANARLMRATFLKEQGMQYVLAANAKGLRQRTVTVVHILKNSLLPVITMSGTRFAGILGGSAVIESIFSLPGIGSYTLTAIQNRDYFVVQAYVLYMGAIYVCMNLLIDLLYFILNPKMKLKDENR
nr:ABC transporter permease [uncultured Blautia sp.]